MSEEKFNEVMPGEAYLQNGPARNAVNVKVNPRNGLNLSTLPKHSPLLEPDWAEYARNGDLKKIKTMEIGITDSEGLTPLHYAAAYGHNDMVEFLLKNVQDISQQDNIGRTPLHLAAYHGRYRIVELLLKNGYDVSKPDNEGSTPLHYAAANRQNRIVELLIENGQDVSQPDNEGSTPLHIAATKGLVITTHILLSKGANTQAEIKGAKDVKGKTPLELVKIILETGKLLGREIKMNPRLKEDYREIEADLILYTPKGGRRTRKRSKRSKRQSRKN